MNKKPQKGALPVRLSGLKVWQLVLLLVLVVGGGVVFMGAISGWFDGKKIDLSPEVRCESGCEKHLVDIGVAEYAELLAKRRSFVLMVDQDGCNTADKLREFVETYAADADIKVYRMMFGEMKETSLHDYVKYYPSVVLVSNGRVVTWLKADENIDADKYNDYSSFRAWMGTYLHKV